jgi:hypothetical protein
MDIYGTPFGKDNKVSKNEIAEPDVEYTYDKQTVAIYSGDRDIVAYPSPSSFSINLVNTCGGSFKNVKSVRLISAVLPDMNNVLREPALVLNIRELANQGMYGSNSTLQDGSSVMLLDKVISAGYFINIKTDMCKEMYNNYNQPLAELSKLTVNIKDINGNNFNFGTDSGSVTKAQQVLLMFEVITENVLFKKYRNVF